MNTSSFSFNRRLRKKNCIDYACGCVCVCDKRRQRDGAPRREVVRPFIFVPFGFRVLAGFIDFLPIVLHNGLLEMFSFSITPSLAQKLLATQANLTSFADALFTFRKLEVKESKARILSPLETAATKWSFQIDFVTHRTKTTTMLFLHFRSTSCKM